MKSVIDSCLLLLVACFFAGCATFTRMVKSDFGDVEITSDPPGASVFIDWVEVGRTPFVLCGRLRKPSASAVLHIKLVGYETYKTKLKSTIHPSAYGNALFAIGWYPGMAVGVIGMYVDMLSGNGFVYKPSKVHAVFTVPAPKTQSILPADPTRSLICIYRPRMDVSSVWPPVTIYVNGNKLCKLKNGSYTTIEVDEGNYSLTWSCIANWGLKPEVVELEAKPGEVSFLRFVPRSNYSSFHDSTFVLFKQVPWIEGESAVAECVYISSE